MVEETRGVGTVKGTTAEEGKGTGEDERLPPTPVSLFVRSQ